jgi:hypothetical protein
MSTFWKYIPLSSLMASVKSDLNLYDDAGMIDEDRVIKVIAECNQKLGQKIYKSRECKLTVVNSKAEVPRDLFKINNISAFQIYNVQHSDPDFNSMQVEFTSEKPKDISKIITYGKIACEDSCNNCYWVTNNKKHIERETIYKRLVPLNYSSNIINKGCNKHNINSQYTVDLQDNIFRFNFESGDVYLDYLGDLITDDGEIEIPFHPMLNPYYEYSVKEKILEDIYLNSEADILQKLQYISQKRLDAYGKAWSFVQTEDYKEWNKIQKKLREEHWNKWYKSYSI